MKKRSIFINLMTADKQQRWHLKIADWLNSQERRKIHHFFNKKTLSEEQRDLMEKKSVVLFYLEDRFSDDEDEGMIVAQNRNDYFCIM